MNFAALKTDKPLHLLPLMAGIAALLFGAAGVARTMGWQPNSADAFGDILANPTLTEASARPFSVQANQTPSQEVDNASIKRRCAECGVVVSIREVDVSGEGPTLDTPDRAVGAKVMEKSVKSDKRYEFLIRLNNGSSRLITDANRSAWRLGERISIIDGMNPKDK